MPRQIAYLSEAARINALIFAYDDDTYDRPQELEPLRKVASLTVLPFNACQTGHRTVFTDCFRRNAKAQIVAFIRNNLK